MATDLTTIKHIIKEKDSDTTKKSWDEFPKFQHNFPKLVGSQFNTSLQSAKHPKYGRLPTWLTNSTIHPQLQTYKKCIAWTRKANSLHVPGQINASWMSNRNFIFYWAFCYLQSLNLAKECSETSRFAHNTNGVENYRGEVRVSSVFCCQHQTCKATSHSLPGRNAAHGLVLIQLKQRHENSRQCFGIHGDCGLFVGES